MLEMAAILLFPACTGLFDGIYDEPETDKPSTIIDEDGTSVSGTLYIDASDWKEWYYIDLPSLLDLTTRQQAILLTQRPYTIPTTLTDTSDKKTGIYIYWYDVWGEGITVNEYREFQPADAQASPSAWSFAVHRNNVRTNGGGACETSLTDISQLSMSRKELALLPYTNDIWTENTVWTDQSQMLNCLIGSQGIAVNPVLSSWLHVDLPPIPPSFTHNNHVFILKLADDSYAALQLANYQDEAGKKCVLTINYKYPL